MKNINICVACDDNYAQYAGVVIASALRSSMKNENLTFYILDGGISELNKEKINYLKNIKLCEINFIKINNDMFADYLKIKTHSYITIPTYYRLKLPTLLPNVDRVIYLDCDVIVNSSLFELFNVEMGDAVVAGVKDLNKRITKNNPNYVNAGVLVFNIQNMKKQNVEQEFLEWTNSHKDTIKLGDQEIINEVLKNRIKLVDDEWNVQSSNFINRSSYTNNPKIIHFVAKQKPWHFGSFSYHKNYYFENLFYTPWALQTQEDEDYWIRKNKICSVLNYIKYRPLFMFRPRFYTALYCTYIKPLFINTPIIESNTFIVWEPCSKSHSEVLPGYVKYLLDLGYHVSVCACKSRYKEGLFERFKDKNVTLNKLSRKQVQKFFLKNDLKNVSGVLVTTVGKLCDEIHFEDAYKSFNKKIDSSKLFFVSHESVHAINAGTWRSDLITLRQLNYKNASSVVVNPHYFGEVKITGKNSDITNFITIGAIQAKKKNNELIINSVKKLHEKGYRNFKVTVVGKGNLNGLPKELRQYFDIKGRLDFRDMYNEIEKADFILTSYDETKPEHIRYNTTGTSGIFQLVYGFTKPCIIIESFAPINGFNDSNSIIYKSDKNYSEALECGINMSIKEYSKMQMNLKKYASQLYNNSLENLKQLIDKN